MLTGIIGVIIAVLAMGAAVRGDQTSANTSAKPITKVAVKASPRAMFANTGTNVTCSVDRHPDNRLLRIGVSESRESEKQLDGLSSRVTHTLQVLEVHCESRVAYCIVERSTGEVLIAEIPLTVLGCE